MSTVQPIRPAAQSRMTLLSVIGGAVEQADKVLLQGVEGVGKSTFGANAPSPIFLASEDGVSQIGPARFPEPKNWQEVTDAINVLLNEEHPYKTLVIDTVDWLEPLAYAEVCRKNGWTHIEDAGYGKGYQITTDLIWRPFLQKLDQLRRKGMEVILLAHATIKNFANPAGPDYARYEGALNKNTYNVIKQWADSVLFATFEDDAVDAKTGKTVDDVATKKRVKGVSTGRRVIHTERCAAWDAKNRYSMPPAIPLSYADYAAHRAAFFQGKTVAAPAELVAACEALLPKVDEAVATKAKAHLDSIRNNGPALLQALNRLQTLAAEKAKEN